MNKFTIITPSYNNLDYVEYNLASILNQTYTNWRLLYIDDCSTDGTFEKVSEILKDNAQCKVIRNEINKGAAYNYIEPVRHLFPEDDEIIVHLDGDDWFFDESVLEKLNDFYNKTECWMTYGQFVCWDGSDNVTKSFPQGTPYDDFIHRHKFYRRDQWRASHLRTYRYSLWKNIDREDLKSKIDGEYYWHASDLAWAFPALEMCPKDKIGVVDFTTHVYNATPKNQVRTKEREVIDNSKYEVEIRNKKIYREGLGNGKLPQINVFNKDYYMEYNSVPKKFTYCYEQTDGEFDMVLLCDPAIKDYLEGRIKIDRNVPIVARLFEQREYFHKELYNLVIQHQDKFHTILTFDRELLKLLPNAKFLPPTEVTQFNRLPNPAGHAPYKSEEFTQYEIPEDKAYQIFPKSKLVSAVVSTKAFLPGHKKRLEFIQAIKNRIDLYGRGIREIPSKLDALRDYMFNIAIENVSCDDNYFSEKIIDCFLTGTVPVYHGCIHIGEFFDERGILSFQTQEELDAIMDSLTLEKYQEMLPYIEANYKKCFEWPLNNDMLYDNYYKNIIDGTNL
jgi:glycosyltransferase involved in cell wall biosynthesis